MAKLVTTSMVKAKSRLERGALLGSVGSRKNLDITPPAPS